MVKGGGSAAAGIDEQEQLALKLNPCWLNKSPSHSDDGVYVVFNGTRQARLVFFCIFSTAQRRRIFMFVSVAAATKKELWPA